jgi:hypothetical protein
MTLESAGLEAALDGFERDIEGALRSLGAAQKEAKRAKAAAAVGEIRQLQQAADNAVRLAEQAATAVTEARAGWAFDIGEWFASGDYTKELLASASEAGVRAFESDDRILSYPAVVQISAADTSVLVDKKKERRIRPSVIVRQLAALQNKLPSFKPEAFLASLLRAYDLVVGANGVRPGQAVKLVDVHGVLTLLPGAARDYTRQEFARDLYLLDQSRIVDTKDGRRLSLPASALTRGSGVLTTVARTGQTKVYAGIAFSRPSGTSA